MKKLNILFYSYPDYSDNARALYSYMNDRYGTKINYYWVIENKEKYDFYKSKFKCVLNHSEDLEKILPKIDIFFTTHGQLMEKKTKNQIYVNLWHGISPKKVGYLLKKELLAAHDDDFYKKASNLFDYTIVPSKLWQYIFSLKFNSEFNRVLPIGFPKLNYILNSNGKDNLQKIIKNKDISLYSKIIFYMPTLKKGIGRLDSNPNKNNIFNINPYSEDILLEFLEKNNYLLCVKTHPSEETKYKKFNNNNVVYINTKDLAEEGLDINQVINGCDLLITDYSSIGFEFLITKKPVLYLNNDIQNFTSNRGIVFDDANFWFELKERNIDDLLSDISNGLTRKFDKKLLNKYLEDVPDDGGCHNICNYFIDSKSFRLNKDIKPSYRGIAYLELLELRDEDYKNKKRIEYLEEKEQELIAIKYSRSYKIANKIKNVTSHLSFNKSKK